MSRSSFVNISAMLVLPSQWEMVINLERIDSRTALSRICKCRRFLEVVPLDQHTAAMLSLKIGMEAGQKVSLTCMSEMMW